MFSMNPVVATSYIHLCASWADKELGSRAIYAACKRVDVSVELYLIM